MKRKSHVRFGERGGETRWPSDQKVRSAPTLRTAGFLISSYKHILKANTDARGNNALTPDERGQLAQNFTGYDISPDMVRLSLVNMYLHGFADPHIYEYDTLTSQDRWNEYADVILANPPFMSPKGGIQPHNRFTVQSKRSEVLFVDYIAEHLKPGGRAGVIVPEGIIFQSGTAYRQLRETLINDFLIGVISLPSGVFMPYTGVKTSILILDRTAVKQNSNVLFSEVKHIGVSLGVKRTPTEHNDLPYVANDYRAYYEGYELSRHSWVASREEILANDCNLTVGRYRPITATSGRQIVPIGDVCRITKGTFSSTSTPPGPYPLILTAAEAKSSADYQLEGPAVCVPLISSLGHGKAALHRIHFVMGRFALANLLVALQPRNESELDAKFLYYTLDVKRADIAGLMRGAANVSMKPEDIAEFPIPLPPLEMQKEIVAQIEGYQKIIDGARAVLDGYRPDIPILPGWPTTKLRNICSLISGQHVDREDYNVDGRGVAYLTGPADFGVISPVVSKWTEHPKVFASQGDILITVKGSGLGKVNLLTIGEAAISRQLMAIRVTGAIPAFVYILLLGKFDYFQSLSEGSAIPGITRDHVLELPVPLPPLETQRQVVAEIEAEQELVNGNRELITRFEKKIQSTIALIWDEGSPSTTKA